MYQHFITIGYLPPKMQIKPLKCHRHGFITPMRRRIVSPLKKQMSSSDEMKHSSKIAAVCAVYTNYVGLVIQGYAESLMLPLAFV